MTSWILLTDASAARPRSAASFSTCCHSRVVRPAYPSHNLPPTLRIRPGCVAPCRRVRNLERLSPRRLALGEGIFVRPDFSTLLPHTAAEAASWRASYIYCHCCPVLEGAREGCHMHSFPKPWYTQEYIDNRQCALNEAVSSACLRRQKAKKRRAQALERSLDAVVVIKNAFAVRSSRAGAFTYLLPYSPQPTCFAPPDAFSRPMMPYTTRGTHFPTHVNVVDDDDT